MWHRKEHPCRWDAGFPKDTMAKKKPPESADIFEAINAEFGAGTLLDMGSAKPSGYDAISTGSIGLDAALGIGGLPRGRIVETYGPESSGKTTLTLHVIANAMKQGLRCAFIDAEHALDMHYARALGVDPKLFAVSQPDYGEQALNITERLVKSGQCGVVVVDSVAALVPKDELEGNVGDFHVGKQARMMGQALRKLVSATADTNTLLIFINQTRAKIGGRGNPETTTGGNALKFYASVRLRIARTGSTTAGGERIANTTKAKVVKNKCSPPFREAMFEIEFGKGISKVGEIIDHGIDAGLVKKAGAWFSLADGKRIGQGKENAKQWLRENPEVCTDLEQKITARLLGCKT